MQVSLERHAYWFHLFPDPCPCLSAAQPWVPVAYGSGWARQLTLPTLSGPGLLELSPVFMNKVLLVHGHSHVFTIICGCFGNWKREGLRPMPWPRHRQYLPSAPWQGKVPACLAHFLLQNHKWTGCSLVLQHTLDGDTLSSSVQCKGQFSCTVKLLLGYIVFQTLNPNNFPPLTYYWALWTPVVQGCGLVRGHVTGSHERHFEMLKLTHSLSFRPLKLNKPNNKGNLHNLNLKGIIYY